MEWDGELWLTSKVTPGTSCQHRGPVGTTYLRDQVPKGEGAGFLEKFDLSVGVSLISLLSHEAHVVHSSSNAHGGGCRSSTFPSDPAEKPPAAAPS